MVPFQFFGSAREFQILSYDWIIRKQKKRPLEETLKDSLTQFSPRSGRASPAGSLSEGCGGNGVNSQGKWTLPPLKLYRVPPITTTCSFDSFFTSFRNLKIFFGSREGAKSHSSLSTHSFLLLYCFHNEKSFLKRIFLKI